MSDKITVTGYGRTQTEAEADARRQIDDLRTIDDSTRLTIGAMSLGMRVVTGYLQLAWVLVLSLTIRPLATLMATLGAAVGVTLFWLLIVLIFGSDEPARALHPFEHFLGLVLTIIVGAGLAAGIAPFVLPFTALFAETEMAILRRTPLVLRAPLMVATTCWPLFLPLGYVAQQGGWSVSGMAWVIGGWSAGNYILWALICLGLLGMVYGVRMSESLSAREFTWYGTPRTARDDAETAEPDMATTEQDHIARQ